MTDQQHPTIVPRDLTRQMREQAPRYRDGGAGREEWLIEHAAQWGYELRGEVNEAELQKARDQELEECCEWLKRKGWEYIPDDLRAARRPKPPSLKGQALNHFELFAPTFESIGGDSDLIIRALKALPDA